MIPFWLGGPILSPTRHAQMQPVQLIPPHSLSSILLSPLYLYSIYIYILERVLQRDTMCGGPGIDSQPKMIANACTVLSCNV